MLEIASAALLLSLAALAAAILYRRQYRLKPVRLKFPFGEFEVSRFDSLSIVHFFNQTTAWTLPKSAWRISEDDHPIAIMHAGWMMVCDAFITRTGCYPTDEHVLDAAALIGGQNAEFVILFRRLYQRSIAEGDMLKREFAEAFATRGPALAQRVLGNPEPLAVFAKGQYKKWGLSDLSGIGGR